MGVLFTLVVEQGGSFGEGAAEVSMYSIIFALVKLTCILLALGLPDEPDTVGMVEATIAPCLPPDSFIFFGGLSGFSNFSSTRLLFPDGVDASSFFQTNTQIKSYY